MATPKQNRGKITNICKYLVTVIPFAVFLSVQIVSDLLILSRTAEFDSSIQNTVPKRGLFRYRERVKKLLKIKT